MKQYLDLLRYVLKNGKIRKNRTSIDAISTFGYQTTYDISEYFDFLTSSSELTFSNKVII